MVKSKISFKKKSTLDSDEFDSKYVKVLISTRLDEEKIRRIVRDEMKRTG